MTQKIHRYIETEPRVTCTSHSNRSDEIEGILRNVTGWFVGPNLFAAPMKTYDHPILLGAEGAKGSYSDELRPGLKVVMPKGPASADVVVLQENNALCFTLSDIFSSVPAVRKIADVEYDRSGLNPNPIQLNPDRQMHRLHVIEGVRTQEHGLLRRADPELQHRVSTLLPHMSEDQMMRLQMPAVAVHHVSAALGRYGTAAA